MGIWWKVSAHKCFKGTVRQIDLEEAGLGRGDRPTRRPAGRVTPGVKLDELKKAVDDGTVDTVLLAIADMEGRLQGKRLTARTSSTTCVEHGAEGCNYLLAVDVDMETVDGYEMSSWERGYGDFEMKPDLDTLRPIPWHPATVLVMADLQWEDGSEVVASPAPDPAPPARPAGRARADRQRRHRARVHASSRTPTRTPGARATATWSRPTSTTSTTRCWAPRGWSR